MQAEPNPVLRIIHSRKSVRSFTGQKADRETLEVLIRAGMAAPSARDFRPWFFIAVTDDAVLQELADGLPHAKMLPSAGAAIVVCGDMKIAHSGAHPELWVQDCSAATENILLATESMGLGAVWTACYPYDERAGQAIAVLGLPPHIVPLNVIAVGYPSGKDHPKDKFDPSRIRWEKW